MGLVKEAFFIMSACQLTIKQVFFPYCQLLCQQLIGVKKAEIINCLVAFNTPISHSSLIIAETLTALKAGGIDAKKPMPITVMATTTKSMKRILMG